jgi:hypothetical protein
MGEVFLGWVEAIFGRHCHYVFKCSKLMFASNCLFFPERLAEQIDIDTDGFYLIRKKTGQKERQVWCSFDGVQFSFKDFRFMKK